MVNPRSFPGQAKVCISGQDIADPDELDEFVEPVGEDWDIERHVLILIWGYDKSGELDRLAAWCGSG
jgi:hypothetical protein